MWLRQRCADLNMNVDGFIAQMRNHGQNVDRATVTAWVTGQQPVPVEDIHFRRILSKVLNLSGHELVKVSGYGATIDFAPPPRKYSAEAELAAQIIDQLNAERRSLAVRLLKTLLHP